MRILFSHGIKLCAVLAVLLLIAAGCSSSGGEGGTTPTPTPDPEDPASNLAAIALVATQNSINPTESTTLIAMAYSANGDGIAGETLAFTVDDPTLGVVTSTATTATDGTATVTFTARNNPGTVNITATSGTVSSSPRTITILDQTSPSNVVLSVSSTSVSVTNTATVTATVTDNSGAPVDNGTTVSFEVTNSTYGTITASAVTNAGTASATFIASSNPGTATIRATSGAATATINITVSPVAAASITFMSVSQNPIAIRGTGVNEFAIITFDVKDVNGNPAQDIDVLFTMAGPGGLEYIEEDDTTPTTHTVGTISGVAEITLYSGYEPGPVTITASITTASGATITAMTPVISIGGGVPTDRWLSISSDNWVMGGLVYEGIETEITAWLADRYGNFNVLDGHSVSFQSEPGVALYASNATADAYGTATVTVRTQSYPQDVVPEDWECDLIYSLTGGNYTPGGGGAIDPNIVDFSGGLQTLPDGHPRDGVASVLVHTKGEEHFFDGSGSQPLNGLYDLGETFSDTADDPFRDYDDDGLWDDGSASTPLTTYTAGANPHEEYVDVANNSVWDGINGVWDADKMIFRNPAFLVTGSPLIYFDVPSFAVPDGGTIAVNILICDVNYNIMTPGSTVSISIDKGEVYGPGTTVEYEYLNTPLAFGPDAYSHFLRLWFPVSIVDDEPTDAMPPVLTSLDVEVTWVNPGKDTLVVTKSLLGTID